jgi:hypothetical protein
VAVLAVVVVGGAEFAVHHSTISCELLRAPANSCELLTQSNLVCIVDCYLRIGRRRGVGRYFDVDYLRDVIINTARSSDFEPLGSFCILMTNEEDR